VSPFQVGAALAVLAGGLLAISARDPRWIAGGLVVALGLASVVADPLPSPLAVAIRAVAALLGAYLVLLALRTDTGTTWTTPANGPPLGPISPALAALAAGVVGYTAAGVGSAAPGPALATAAGLGLATLAVGPLLLGRDIVRVGTGVTLLLTAAELVRAGLAGTPGSLEQAVIAGLSVAILGTLAAIVALALRSGHDLSIDANLPRETLFEAHPLGAATQRVAGRALRRAPRAARPASLPRRDAAHQLTLEERLRLGGASAEGAPGLALPDEGAPAAASSDSPSDTPPDPPGETPADPPGAAADHLPE
jgi:hypothetical protein